MQTQASTQEKEKESPRLQIFPHGTSMKISGELL